MSEKERKKEKEILEKLQTIYILQQLKRKKRRSLIRSL